MTQRAAQYFWATYFPTTVSKAPPNLYLAALADQDGEPLLADKLYKLDIPADMPARQFWSVTVYDRAGFSFIYSDSGRTTLSTYDLDNMSKNDDGTVTIYIGPAAPNGLESNWIPTSGKRPMPTIRYYGATAAASDGTCRMPDVELVDSQD